MPELSFRPRPGLKTSVSPQLWGRVKLSNFMELPEDEFRHLIKQVEDQPVFKRLLGFSNRQEKIITRQRFPQTDLASHFYQIKDEITAGSVAPDIAPLLKKRQEIIPRIKKIGEKNFKRFFLYSENNLSTERIARVCKIKPAEVKLIRELMDEISVLDLTQPTSVTPLSSAHTAPGVKIATIEADNGAVAGQNQFRIGYFSPAYARGRYVVDYKKLVQLKARDRFTQEESRKIERLIKQIELINARKTILYQIIKKLLDIQMDYFRTGQEASLTPLTQQMLARHLKVHRSTVNRAVNHKYLETPWGEVRYLKSFLNNQKQFVKRILLQITKDATAKLTDDSIKKILEEKYHIKLARRTICAYRQELNKKSS